MSIPDSHLEPVRQAIAKLEVPAELKERALESLKHWLSDAQFAPARPQLKSAIDSRDAKKLLTLFDAFFQTIPFGTGGRRGPVGFGPNRINPYTVATSIEGHCRFLRRHQPRGASVSVVVAFDVRVFRDLRGIYDPGIPNPLLEMTSRDFAKIAAEVYAANGITVWFPDPDGEAYLSTPELSFAVRKLGAAGGLNVSASHNHPDDNGAKIYNADGAQDIPPLDEEMAAIVEGVQSAPRMPWRDAIRAGHIQPLPAAVHEEFVRTNCAASRQPERRSARLVFTPLHGTGCSSVGDTLEAARFQVNCVPSQARPDGGFPTVPFRSPNPEVPQALDLAIEFARGCKADVVLASDPDADRLGMAVPGPKDAWTCLTGNQIGVLLAAYVLEREAKSPRRKRPFIATTVVTTSLIRRMAESHGVDVVADLPIGFKYIANILNAIEKTGDYAGRIHGEPSDFLLGLEESHGYLVVPDVRDKDAAGAALLLAELASELKDAGGSVLEHLDSIYLRYGYVANFLVSTIMEGAQGFADMNRIQESLRREQPLEIGGLKLTSFVDRSDASGPFGPILSETDRKARDLLAFEVEGGQRVILRPSGTEPKNKIYVEAVGEPLGNRASRGDLEALKAKVDAEARRIARSFTRQMLARIDVHLPPYALEAADLVTLDDKRRFANAFLPELLDRLERGQPGPEIEAWIDAAWKRYGKEGRYLFSAAVSSYLDSQQVRGPIQDRMRGMFSTKKC